MRNRVLRSMLLRFTLVGVALLIGMIGVSAQTGRSLVPGVPVTGTLDGETLVQVYTLQAAGEVSVALTVTNTQDAPLIVAVTDDSGETLAQATEADTAGETIIETVTLPDAGLYYVTVFNAPGADATDEVEFTLIADDVASFGTQPTANATASPNPNAAAPSPSPTLPAVNIGTPVAPGVIGLTPSAEVTQDAEATVSPEGTQAVDVSFAQFVTTAGMTIALDWNTSDDLDLEVRDPVGGSLYWTTPQVPSGGSLSANVNQGCAVLTNPATETATWTPGGIPTGSYEVIVYFQEDCEAANPVTFNVNVTVDGVVLEPFTATVLAAQNFVTAFEVNSDGSAAFTGASGIEADQVLPATPGEILASAQPLDLGTSVDGFIDNENPYQAYSFTANVNDLVTIGMTATSGSLDTYIAILDAQGVVVRANDDQTVGSTDSLLSGTLLTQAGTYTIVATRYAKAVGGTEGDYTLTFGTEVSNLPAEFATLPRGALEIRLLWDTNADLQLLLRDPAGDAVFDDVPTIRSGGILAAQGNVNCTVTDGDAYSYIYYPLEVAPRPGSYEVEVWYQNECADTTPVSFDLYITYNNQEVFSDSAQPILNERYLTSFTLNADGSAQPSQGGIIRGLETLDYESELPSATALLTGSPVNNVAITPDNKFDVYVFLGQAGDVVNIGMNTQSGTLDPTLYLIGPSGALIVENDDAVAGENTNSLIADLTLPADGQYIIIATHFGALYGGTTGTYQLTLTQRN